MVFFCINKTDFVDVVFLKLVVGLGGRVGVSLECKGEGSWFQTRDLGWMGIRHHEQDIGLPSKWVFSYRTRGYARYH